MRSFLFLLILFISSSAFSSPKTDSLFEQLKNELNNNSVYEHQKEVTIQKLKKAAHLLSKNNLQGQFNAYIKLYDEYKSYQYDSAYVYATKLLELSHALKDKSKEDYSK